MNATNFKKLLQIMIRAQIKKSVPLMWGPTGGGKTTITRHTALEFGMNFMSFSCETLTDPADLRGGIVNVQGEKVGDRRIFNMQYSVPELIDFLNRNPTVLLFDELVRTPPQSQAALMSVFTEERRMGLHKIPDHTVIIAAANPTGGSDYFGNELDLAQAERFCHISYAPDQNEVLEYLAGNERVHSGILDYFETTSNSIYAPFLQVPYKAKATPRSIEAAGEWYRAMTKDEFENFGAEVFEGLLSEHTHGVIQSIKNSYELPVPPEELINGKGLKKLTEWNGKRSKIGLLQATLRQLDSAIEKSGDKESGEGGKAWAELAKAASKDIKALEPLSRCLVQFPPDLMRRYLKEESNGDGKSGLAGDKAMNIRAQFVRATKDPEKYPATANFGRTMIELRQYEEELLKRLEQAQK